MGRLFILGTILGLAALGVAAQERSIQPSPVEKILIRSAEAREDAEPDLVHFSGGFQLEAEDWDVTADEASLYGKLNSPEKVLLGGSPARIRIRADYRGRSEEIEADADRITYRRDLRRVRLEGSARLVVADQTLSGGEIEYDIDSDRVRAGGEGGVRFKVLPAD